MTITLSDAESFAVYHALMNRLIQATDEVNRTTPGIKRDMALARATALSNVLNDMDRKFVAMDDRS